MRWNLDKHVAPRYEASADGGGGNPEPSGDKVLDALTGVTKSLKDSEERQKATAAEVAKIAEDLAALKTDTDEEVARVAKVAAQVRRDLAVKYGPSGADDWMADLQKYVRGVYGAKIDRAVPDDLELSGEKMADVLSKTAADFTTTTNATAAYLLPQIMLPGLRALMDIYGNFYPRVTAVKAPAGHSIPINRETSRPTASWRGTQVSALTESGAGNSGADSTFGVGQDTLVSILLGSYVQVANEMILSPYVNFAAVLTVRMLEAILRKLEFGLIAGTTGTGEPSDGVIADATDQGSIASMTFANLITFLQACFADNDYASDITKNKIIMTPTDALALASQAVGASELTGMLVWGDPRKGIPTTIMGYELILHPAANNGTNKHVILGDPSTITLVEDSAPAIDVSQHAGNAFIENASLLRVLNHYDWNLGQTAEWHKAVVTA